MMSIFSGLVKKESFKAALRLLWIAVYGWLAIYAGFLLVQIAKGGWPDYLTFLIVLAGGIRGIKREIKG